MKKRLLPLALALALSLSLIAPALAAEPSFTDVSADHWAFESIEDMAAREVVKGVGDGKFAPGNKVACTDFSTMVARLLFAEELKKHTDDTYWWQPYADTLLEAGVLDNTTAKAFYIRLENNWDKAVMEQPMSRYDMAQIMYNALKAKGFELPSEEEMKAAGKEIADYTDVPQEYDDAVAAMYAIGCLKGVDTEGNFRGEEKMDRASACTVLVRMQGKLDAQKEEEPEPSATPEPTPGPEANLMNTRLEMLAMINGVRQKQGLGPVQLDTTLCQAAQVRAEECVSVMDENHTRPDGRQGPSILEDIKFPCMTGGENIAAGQTSVEEVMTDWINSPKHWAVLTHPGFTKVGIGLHYIDGGRHYYWVQLFADDPAPVKAPESSEAAPAGSESSESSGSPEAAPEVSGSSEAEG